MPRYTRAPVRRTRAQADRYYVSGYTGFADPFFLGFGTLPEKIVYYALSARGIPFLYLNDIRFVFPEIGFDQTFQADFIIPSLKIIIEVNGAHWHSMPKTIQADAFKYAIYEQGGYKVLPWWDFDIEADINKLFAETPELNAAAVYHSGNVSYEQHPVARTKTDTSKGIRTLNARRGARQLYKKKAPAVKFRKVANYGSYSALN